MSEVRGYAAFLQNAKNVAGWVPRVGTLGWYAMPRQGMGSEPWCSIGSGLSSEFETPTFVTDGLRMSRCPVFFILRNL